MNQPNNHPDNVTGQDRSDTRDGSSGRVGGHVQGLSGYVPSVEAIEVGARGMVPPSIDPDRPHGVSREPLWTYYVGEATAALAAAVPVEVAREVARLLGEVRALVAEWMAEKGQAASYYRGAAYRLSAVLDTVGVPAQVDAASLSAFRDGWMAAVREARGMGSVENKSWFLDALAARAPSAHPAQVDEAATGGKAHALREDVVRGAHPSWTAHGIDPLVDHLLAAGWSRPLRDRREAATDGDDDEEAPHEFTDDDFATVRHPMFDEATIRADERGKRVALAWQEHLEQVSDSLEEHVSEDYMAGFERAIEEGEVNLHYYVDGTLPRTAQVDEATTGGEQS